MPLGTALNSLKMLLSNLDEKKSTVHVLKLPPSKPLTFDPSNKINYLKRSTPEKHGYSNEYIDSFVNEINSDLSLRANRLLIIKDEEVIKEQYLHPYVKDCWDSTFSATKTLTALAIGLLYDEGKIDLDLPVCKYLKNEKQITIARNKKITLRHLFTMSTGSNFNEMSTVGTTKWTKDYFNSGYKYKLGSKFEYNSLNSYIIGVVAEKISGKPLSELLEERIFSKLGMSSTFIERSMEGHAKCGWGLYILPEDMAKLGILVMNKGVYKGERILSEEWIEMMSHKQFEASKFAHKYDYGFQMWVKDDINFCCFNGMYDQNIMLFRNSGIILVTCFADNEAFHGAHLFSLAEKYFASKEMGEFPLWKYKGDRILENKSNLSYYYDYIVDKEYIPQDKKSNNCGILPLLLQNEMGTYSKGLKAITFKKYSEDKFSVIVKEGNNDYEHFFNFKEGIKQKLNFYGNEYDCSVDGRFILSGKGEPYLLIRVYFLEFACIRYISVKFGKEHDRISIEMSETPSLGFVLSILDVQDEPTKRLIGSIIKGINPNILQAKIKNILSPTFIAAHKEYLQKNQK